MQGTLAFARDDGPDAGELKIHLHATLAGPDQKVVGGHLDSGTVAVLNEIVLLCPEGLRLHRARNPETGLFELDL
jgi:predicted DNA-binding protein with PD1-like motif